MNTKAEKFAKMLTDYKIECFQTEEAGDELHSVIFRSTIEIEGQALPTALIIDDSIYTMLGVRVAAKAAKESNRAELQDYLNQLNLQYKVFKYLFNDEGDVMLNVCLCSAEEQFDCELVRTLLDVTIQHLNEQYPPLMKKIWA